MKKYNVLVTGVGAIVGYGIISSLRKSKYNLNIIGMDIYQDAVGQFWCDEFVKAVLASDDGYISFLKRIIEEYSVDLVFFGTEQEIQKCFRHKKELGLDYNKLVINADMLIDLSEDKWNTTKFMMENGLNYIPSSINPDYDEAVSRFGLPLLMKPRRSYASKGIKIVNNKEDFVAWKEKYRDQFLVQKYIGDVDHEYTASTFGFGDGECIEPIVMRRTLSEAGATDKAFVEPNNDIDKEIKKISKLLKPKGPTNFQFRYQDGKYYLLEINPRISSATSIRAAFGYNEAEMCIDYFVEGVKPKLNFLRTGKAFRYITEAIVYNDSNNI